MSIARFSAKSVGQKFIDNLSAGVGEQGGCDDASNLCFAETELAADGATGQRQIVTAHVERGIEQADERPVQTAARTKARRMRNENGSVRARSHDLKMRRTETPAQ